MLCESTRAENIILSMPSFDAKSNARCERESSMPPELALYRIDSQTEEGLREQCARLGECSETRSENCPNLRTTR